MDWKKCAIEDLRKYNSMKSSIGLMHDRIAALNCSFKAIRCSTSDATPVKGGGNGAEDRLINNIVERERIGFNLEATEKLVNIIGRGIKSLDEKDYKILDAFYMSGSRSVGKLMQELGYEERQIYNLKDRALYKFTVEMYGMTDY